MKPPEHSTSSIHSNASNAVVLVCDDDADSRAIIGMTMKAVGYQVIEAEDGEVAIKRCQEKLPDVVVMDIMMPRLTGLEFVEWIRREIKDRYVPVLLLTALTELEHRVAGLEQGADDYVTKPFQTRELQARVHALLRIKMLTEQLYHRSGELEKLNQELSRMQDTLIAREREIVAVQFAGAAAHNLGQPVTSIMLNCYLIEKNLGVVKKEDSQGDTSVETIQKSLQAVRVIQKECEVIRAIVNKLKIIDPTQTKDYLDGIKILDFGETGNSKQSS